MIDLTNQIVIQNETAKEILNKYLRRYYPKIYDIVYEAFLLKYADWSYRWNMSTIGLHRWEIVVMSKCEMYRNLEKIFLKYEDMRAGARRKTKSTRTDNTAVTTKVETVTTGENEEKYNPIATQSSKTSGIVKNTADGISETTVSGGGAGHELVDETEEESETQQESFDYVNFLQKIGNPVCGFVNSFQGILLSPYDDE